MLISELLLKDAVPNHVLTGDEISTYEAIEKKIIFHHKQYECKITENTFMALMTFIVWLNIDK